VNTRIDITNNNLLHLGHAYVALVNYTEAHATGGTMHLLLDDIQPYWTNRVGELEMEEYALDAVEDLEWLDITIGNVVSQREHMATIQEWLDGVGYHECPLTGDERHDYEKAAFVLQRDPGRPLYPYVPYLTACKVAWDCLLEVEHVIRGDDIITEAALYAYFCERFGIPVPKQTFLPRLRLKDGEMTDVSKTAGNWKLRDLRVSGWTPEQVLATLARSCLIDPNGGWFCRNIKPNPILEVEDGISKSVASLFAPGAAIPW
jgi:glutamyl/glutaminyl-tRNA synthetase